jgi:hypothetical protein
MKGFPLQNGMFYAPFSGMLSLHDNHLELSPVLSLRHQEAIALHKKRTLFDQPQIKRLVDRLNEVSCKNQGLWHNELFQKRQASNEFYFLIRVVYPHQHLRFIWKTRR